MIAVTGIVVSVPETGRPLEDCVRGAGLMHALRTNANLQAVQARIVTTGDRLASVSQPARGFLGAGDAVTAVRDGDGCEFHYVNHSTERTMTLPRPPAEIRRLDWLLRIALNVSVFATFGTWVFWMFSGSGRTNPVDDALVACVMALTAAVGWLLLVRWPSSVMHRRAARKLAIEAAKEHAAFIEDALREQAGGLRGSSAGRGS